jgi:hypothetical protein
VARQRDDPITYRFDAYNMSALKQIGCLSTRYRSGGLARRESGIETTTQRVEPSVWMINYACMLNMAAITSTNWIVL